MIKNKQLNKLLVINKVHLLFLNYLLVANFVF